MVRVAKERMKDLLDLLEHWQEHPGQQIRAPEAEEVHHIS
jgi:hypothetical protein